MAQDKAAKIYSPRNHTVTLADSDRELLTPHLCHAHDALSHFEIVNKIFIPFCLEISSKLYNDENISKKSKVLGSKASKL